MSFKEDMLDGFDVLYARTAGVLKSAKEQKRFFEKLANVESQYVTLLGDVIKKAQKKMLQNQYLDGNVKESYCVIVNELENVASQHNKLAQQLGGNASDLASFTKEKEGRRKKLTSDAHQLTKDMAVQRDLLAKAHSNYIKLSKEAENCQLSLVKAQADSNIKPNKLAQVNAKSSSANDKARIADQEYQDVLRDFNQKQALFYETEMPSLLSEFQKFEEERIEFARQRLVQYVTFTKELPTFYEHSVATVEQLVEAIEVSADIVSFVEANKTGVSVPPPVDYEGFDGSKKPSGGGAPSAGSQRSGGAGGKSPSSSEDKVWGLTPADDNLNDEAKIKKLEGQLQELENVMQSEDQQRDGLRRLVQFYANEPIPRKKTEDELKDSESKIAVRQKQRENVVSLLDALRGNPVDTEEAYQGDEGEDLPQVNVKCRGLYDYTATCETELSFTEGDILTVTEQDSSGWWYAELNGQAGFVPQNYVQVLDKQ